MNFEHLVMNLLYDGLFGDLGAYIRHSQAGQCPNAGNDQQRAYDDLKKGRTIIGRHTVATYEHDGIICDVIEEEVTRI